jgi:hypothetical protein
MSNFLSSWVYYLFRKNKPVRSIQSSGVRIITLIIANKSSFRIFWVSLQQTDYAYNNRTWKNYTEPYLSRQTYKIKGKKWKYDLFLWLSLCQE